MYRLTVYGGEYEDKFERIYFSNSVEKLKEEGMEDLMYDEDACSFYIHEIKLEGDEVIRDPYSNPLYSVNIDDVEDEINFKRLMNILKANKTDTVSFGFNMCYLGGEISCTFQITKIDNNRVKITKFNDVNKEVLNYKEYTIENCKGSLVEQAIIYYNAHCEYSECEYSEEE